MAAAASSWVDMVTAAAQQHAEEWAAVEAMTAPGTILNALSACTTCDAFRTLGYAEAYDSSYRDTVNTPDRPTEIRIRPLGNYVEYTYIFDGYTVEMSRRRELKHIWTLTRPGHSGFGPPAIVRENQMVFQNETSAHHNLFGPSTYTTDWRTEWRINGEFYATPEKFNKAVAQILTDNPDLPRPRGSRTKAARA